MVKEYLSEIAKVCGIKDTQSNLCLEIQAYIHDQRDIEFINNLTFLSDMELMELYYQLSNKKDKLDHKLSSPKMLLRVFDKCIQVIKDGLFTPEEIVEISLGITKKVNRIRERIDRFGEEKVYDMYIKKDDELFKRYLV
jgi:hypothetical protein